MDKRKSFTIFEAYHPSPFVSVAVFCDSVWTLPEVGLSSQTLDVVHAEVVGHLSKVRLLGEFTTQKPKHPGYNAA